jgi:hypothetical protein
MKKDDVPIEFIELLERANEKTLISIEKKAISLTGDRPCTEHKQLIPFYLHLKAR